jgi:hypothetical protein
MVLEPRGLLIVESAMSAPGLRFTSSKLCGETCWKSGKNSDGKKWKSVSTVDLAVERVLRIVLLSL